MAEPMRIGTRGSKLALAQAELIAAMLSEDTPAGAIQITVLSVSGDGGERGAGPADKRRWVDAIEDALLERTIDLAVHSAKDVPGEMSPGLTLLGGPRRAPAHDVLCGAESLESLAPGARVGTSSLRRAAQLSASRSDIEVVPIAGNVDTRLRKLAEDAGWEAIVLAYAGLERLGLEAAASATLDPTRFVPAPGQGMLALQGRDDDPRSAAAVKRIGDPESFACLLAERALAHSLGADCQTPVGAHACPTVEGRVLMRAWVGLPDGSEWACDELEGEIAQPEDLGRRVAERLLCAGAEDLLRRAQEMAAVGGI